MKVSVITTVLNEEDSVESLLDSLLAQTKKPDEIIIVDGGSKDRTPEIIKSYTEKHTFIKIFTLKGNIAKGRNYAIKKATYKIIAQIDAGCVAEKHWLERITKPFIDKKIGVVAGFYDMVAKTPLQKAVAPFHGVPPSKFDPRCYLPSGRSMAFRKKVWRQVGGYSEMLQWGGEDTLFNYHLIKADIEFARVPSAFVYWTVPKTYQETLSKFFKYAKGDAETKIWWHPGKNLATHNIKIATIFIRYVFFFVLFLFSFVHLIFFYLLIMSFIFYTSWSIWKMREEVTDFEAKLLVPIIQISSDFAIMAGFLSGLLR